MIDINLLSNWFLILISALLIFIMTTYVNGLLMIILVVLLPISMFYGLKYFLITLMLLITDIFVDFYKNKKLINFLKSQEKVNK